MFGAEELQCTIPLPTTRINVLTSYFRSPSKDRLYDPEKVLPPRPTITNIQWISGTQYVSPADMDILSTLTLQPPAIKAYLSDLI